MRLENILADFQLLDCARRLGRFAGDAAGLEACAFHAREFNAAVASWAATATNGKSG